jgi:hypothetical protein
MLMSLDGGHVRAFLVLLLFFLSTEVLAKPSLNQTERVKVANAVAVYLNSFNSYDTVIGQMARFLSKDEGAEIKKQFLRLNVDLKQKMPVFTARGAEIKIQGSDRSLKIGPDGSYTFGNSTYWCSLEKSVSHQLKEVIDNELPSQATHHFLIIENAEADAILGTAGGLAAGVVAAAALNPVIDFVGAGLALEAAAPFAPLVVLGGAIWIGMEAYEYIRDGEVACSGKYFVVRQERRTLGIVPSSKNTIIDLDAVQKVLNQPDLRSCSSAAASKFQTAIKNGAVRKQVIDSSSSDSAQ